MTALEYIKSRVKSADENYTDRIDKRLRTQAVTLRNVLRRCRKEDRFLHSDEFKLIAGRCEATEMANKFLRGIKR